MIKRLLLTTAILAVAVSTQAQGTVAFNTRTVSARVFDVDGITPVSGTAAYAQLYFAVGNGASEASLAPIGVPVNFQTTTGGAGYVVTAAPVVANVDSGYPSGPSTVQFRAWSSNFGTYEAAKTAYMAANPAAKIGKSNLINYNTGSTLVTPPNLTGITGFTLEVNTVPEPSTIALGVMGLSALLFRRRK